MYHMKSNYIDNVVALLTVPELTAWTREDKGLQLWLNRKQLVCLFFYRRRVFPQISLLPPVSFYANC